MRMRNDADIICQRALVSCVWSARRLFLCHHYSSGPFRPQFVGGSQIVVEVGFLCGAALFDLLVQQLDRDGPSAFGGYDGL